MRYAIPVEAPPSRLYRLAVRPITPMLGWFVIGTLPALIWMAANAFFLGCRDARRQLTMAVAGFVVVRAISLSAVALEEGGQFEAWFGPEGALVRELIGIATILIVLTILSIMSTRQSDLAVYQASVMGRRRLQWGLTALGVLAVLNFWAVPLIDAQVPYFARFWGKML